jgi:hypothetical protein
VAPRRGVSRASAVGLLLLISVMLGVFQGLFVVLDPELPANQPALYGSSFAINGTVLDANGVPLAGVNVSVPSQNVTTDALGGYRFDAVPSGVIDVEYRAEGNPNGTVRVFLIQDQTVDFRFAATPEEATRVDHGSYRMVSIVFQACGFVLLGCAALCLLGAVAAYRRRSWGLALAGSIAALFVSPPLSLLVGAIAIYMVARGKSEFQVA